MKKGRDQVQEATAMTEAYCVKCKAKREMKNPVPQTLKNGKPAVKGVCPTVRHHDVQDWRRIETVFPLPLVLGPVLSHDITLEC